MLRDVEWSEDRAYRSGSQNEPLQFYIDGLLHSKRLDLLLGYFSSAAIHVLSVGFATFLYNGGSVRMVINNILSKEDRDLIKTGTTGTLASYELDLTDIKRLKSILDDYGIHFFECLAWLIASHKIQTRIVRPKNGGGIAHYKSGIFSDEVDYVGFKASCNFTAFGLTANLEELDSFLSWENDRSNDRVYVQNKYFEELFFAKADFVDYLEVDDVCIAIKDEFGNKDINELLIQEKELTERKQSILENRNLKKAFERAIKHIEEIMREPRFPYPSGPREYQITAYENWLKNGRKGIFAMATGTGKTITALNCLLHVYKESGSYKAIILVPTTSLLEQWKKECSNFNFRNIITVSSGENWNDNLAFYSTADRLTKTSFIVIVTYASLIRDKFQSHFNQLPTDTLLIADEVHNVGSPGILNFLNRIHLERRIGLSATPVRQYDVPGNEAIERFFNDKYPYIYSFSMKKALEMGWLCSYTYTPHVVQLTDAETLEYIRISKVLMKYLDAKTGKYKESKEVEELLLRRKRIIHKAFNKKAALKQILGDELKKRGTLKYTLIYVPEGTKSEFAIADQTIEDADERNLIAEYTWIVKEADDAVMVKQFTSNTPNRDEIIKQFERGMLDVLTSMKCLDEGVDVPRAELAIFCASTGNPRQFIQRRGRVLRTHKDKSHAVIHDLVVIPKMNGEASYDMERSLIVKELQRVVDFSELSINKMDTYEELEEVLDYYNINLNDLIIN